MRCTRRSLRGFLAAGVPVAFGFGSFLTLLYIYGKLFYTELLGTGFVGSVARYVIAGALLGLWLVSWMRVTRSWKRFLLRRQGLLG